jgi:predicted PurR-regulated permease PerM
LSGATFVALFVAALAIWFIVRVVEVLLLVFIAVLCAVYLSAITDLLERRFGLARWMGLVIAVVATLAAVVGIGALLVPPVVEQTQSLISGLPETLTKIQSVLARWASESPVLRNTQLANPANPANPAAAWVGGVVDAAAAFLRSSILPYVTAGGKLFIEAASVVVMALYLARQPRLYRGGILSLVAPKHRALGARVLDDAGATLRAWVVGQLFTMTILAMLTAIGLWALGVPYWLAFGLFTGLVAVVPFFGTLISTLLPALFVVESGDWLRVVAVVALGVVVHVVEGNVVLPRIMHRKVALPPVLTIASVLIMGTLIGVVGLIVAVPVLAVATVVVRHVVLGEIYGDVGAPEAAVLRATERRGGEDRRTTSVAPVGTQTSA